MEFKRVMLKEEFQIHKIVSLHYFEFAKDFIYDGEKHDFWEFLYVDKGEAEVLADTAGYKLRQGDVIFHKPNEFHNVWANKIIGPNLIIVSFECNSKAMKFFANKIFNLNDEERNYLAVITKEGFNTFLPPLDMPAVNTLNKKADRPFGSEQLIKINLELLLISLVRKETPAIGDCRLSSLTKERSEKDIVKRITQYMSENITKNLTLDQLCSFSNLGRSQLKALFKSKTGKSVIEYFKNMKIEQAKNIIREEKYNYTEISEILNYSSIHSFSRHFKNVTGMSPSEYAKTVKARVM